MHISRDWLSDYVELPEVVSELAERLTFAGLAVEGIDSVTLSDGSEDLVLDVDTPTNRPDCMNHLGLAREVATLFGRPLRPPQVELSEAAAAAGEVAALSIEDYELCPRYAGVVIRGVRVGPSPDWLVRRLEAIGSRSINNIVDITNFVLWETGQPLHAFDLERLAAAPAGVPEIRVRRALPGEELVTLDGEHRELDPEILVITDPEGPVALAGIMGGLASEVTDATRDILLESAHFQPAVVRRGAKQLGMHTDASHRFERGADPEGCLAAARRAAALIVEYAGGEVLAGALDDKSLRRDWPPVVELELAKLNRFGGSAIAVAEVEETLAALGFELSRQGEGKWRVVVPSWRYYDFENAYPADLYEELLRIHGLEKIPSTLPQIAGSDAPARPELLRRRKLCDHLAAAGLAEAINFAFHDRQSDESYPTLYQGRRPLEIANPLSDRYAVMRRSLLPNLVASARYNQRRGAAAVLLFEVGHVFCVHGEQGSVEQEALALVVGGSQGNSPFVPLRGNPWERQVEIDFFDLKGMLENLADELGIELELRPAELPRLVAGSTAELRVAGQPQRLLGYMGELDEAEVPYPLFVAELAAEGLTAAAEVSLKTRIPSKYPGIAADSTLTHPLEVSWAELARAIRELAAGELVSFGLKDRYRGPGVPEGAVNTTLYFLYNSDERSLTQEEVNEHNMRLAGELQARFGGSG
ncbi:MAG: phenylalanine--tRNA ligase subunit beta [bacterium]|nr:phenylalanine--tRNA ligase subunit beta [bacterium]